MLTSVDMLQVDALHKSYGEQEVVSGISFEVSPGECFGLLGPNGAGKTTTIRCCLGLALPSAGKVQLAGYPVPKKAREARMHVGIVPQFDNLDPRFTVTENLTVFGRYFDLRRAECEARVPGLLEFAGLSDKRDASVDTLSGGMRRRLTLARALINDPRALFLDEPTTGLDPQARHTVWDRLRSLQTQGRTIIMSSHFMDEVERLCDRVAIVDHGRLIAIDSPRALIEREIEPVVVEVFGEGLQAWLDAHGLQHSIRVEKAADTVFCYCTDPEPLLRTLNGQRSLRALRRVATLEDVFLRLTGRELRE